MVCTQNLQSQVQRLICLFILIVGGGYLYAGFLAPVDPNSRAILVSPAISALPDEILCLRFWFHAGRRVRSTCLLSVMLHHYDGVLSGDIWTRVQSGDDAWKQARIEFEADGPLQVNWN